MTNHAAQLAIIKHVTRQESRSSAGNCSIDVLDCCCCVALVVSNSVRPHRWQPTRFPRPWDSPGKNTGVGCHFPLQCMKGKVKLLSRVRLLEIPWTAAYQNPLSMGFSRQDYWSGLPVPSPTFFLGFTRNLGCFHLQPAAKFGNSKDPP